MMDDEQLEAQEPDPDQPAPSRGSGACGIIGCLLIIGVLVALAAGVYFGGQALEPLADRYLWAPHDVVREYLTAYEDDNTERARRFLCSDIRSGRLLDPAQPVGSPSAWTAGVSDTFPYPRPGGQLAIYYFVQSGLGERQAQALLEREDDGWRICAFADG
jgi:hypothetical protein